MLIHFVIFLTKLESWHAFTRRTWTSTTLAALFCLLLHVAVDGGARQTPQNGDLRPGETEWWDGWDRELSGTSRISCGLNMKSIEKHQASVGFCYISIHFTKSMLTSEMAQIIPSYFVPHLLLIFIFVPCFAPTVEQLLSCLTDS